MRVSKARGGGENWTAVGVSDNPVSVLAVDPITPGTVYAAVADKLYKSTDGATTWTLVDFPYSSASGGAISMILLDPITPSTEFGVLAKTKNAISGYTSHAGNDESDGRYSREEVAPDAPISKGWWAL